MKFAKIRIKMLLIFVVFLLLIDFTKEENEPKKPKVLFDISHGQFQDVFIDPSYYDYVLPGYQEICEEIGEGI